MSENRHVVRDGDGWAVKKPGAERVSSRHDEHDDALARAREIVANAGGGSVVVHAEDGQIERVAKVERGEAGDGSSSTANGADRDGGDSTPPRGDDGKFVAEDGDSTTPRDAAASVLGKRTGKDGGGSVLPESLDTTAVVEKVGKGARTLASALGTAGKVGAAAAVVATSAAVEKKRKLSEAAEIERSRRAGREEIEPDARSDASIGGEETASAGDGLSGPADEHGPLGGAAGRFDRSDDRVADGVRERPSVTAAKPAPRPTQTVSTKRAFEPSGTADEPDRHDVETYGRDAPAVERPTTDVEDIAGSADAVPLPARRSRLLGSLFDRARRYLGADGDRPGSGGDSTRHDGARRDDRRGGGGAG